MEINNTPATTETATTQAAEAATNAQQQTAMGQIFFSVLTQVLNAARENSSSGA